VISLAAVKPGFPQTLMFLQFVRSELEEDLVSLSNQTKQTTPPNDSAGTAKLLN
jgi:hypothetical protein